jgi:hypothetical protein
MAGLRIASIGALLIAATSPLLRACTPTCRVLLRGRKVGLASLREF